MTYPKSYRSWQIKKGKLLSSQGYIWEDGWNEATCMSGTHKPAHINCTCGFYSFLPISPRNLKPLTGFEGKKGKDFHLLHIYWYRSQYYGVKGIISCKGKIVLRHGFRITSHAKIEALYLIGRYRIYQDILEENYPSAKIYIYKSYGEIFKEIYKIPA